VYYEQQSTSELFFASPAVVKEISPARETGKSEASVSKGASFKALPLTPTFPSWRT